ncbi:MAG: AI-2E family transporter [Candidatus Paceibacterota bacterium]
MNSKTKGKFFFYILLGIMSLVVLMIFWPFLTVIILSVSLAVVLHPVFKWINNHVTRKTAWLSALLTVLLFFTALSGLLFFVGAKIVGEAQSLSMFFSDGGVTSNFLDTISSRVNTTFSGIVPDFDLKSKIENAVSSFSGTIITIFSETVNAFLLLFLMLMALFYFLKDGDYFKKYIIALSPLSREFDEQILSMLGRAINGVLGGYLFISIIQGILMGVGLWIFGVPNAALWGVLAGLVSLIPTIGTALVSIPAILFLFATGHVVPAIGLLLWSLALVGGIDNVLSPIIVGKKIQLSPVIVLFSILGGMSFMGPLGIIIGPLAASLFHTLLNIYHHDFEKAN